MVIISWLFIIVILIVNFLFLIPIKIHFYTDNKVIYFYIFSFKIIHIDESKTFNLLKNKISISKIKESAESNLKLIKSFKVKKLVFSVDPKYANQYPFIVYPFFALNEIFEVSYSVKENKFYLLLEIKLINFIYELIKIRRNK